MGNRSHHPLDTTRPEAKMLFAKMTGGGAAADLVAASGLECLDIVSATYSATGVFDIVFRHKYPSKLCPFSPGIVGTTTGLVGIFTAWDPAAGTATVKFSVGNTATDPATDDTIYFCFAVRNSDKN